MSWASSSTRASDRVTRSIAPICADSSSGPSLGSITAFPVGTALVETTAAVRVGEQAARLSGVDAPRASSASSRSQPPAEMRPVPERTSRPMRRSETTGPPFWERPVWSSPATCSPSSIAATPITWLRVTTPVPPMPAMRTVHSPAEGTRGSGRSVGGAGTVRLPPAGTTVRKAGQSPSMQVRSWLQLDWWIRVLRPYSVSIG